jgi:hypothetical protein
MKKTRLIRCFKEIAAVSGQGSLRVENSSPARPVAKGTTPPINSANGKS